MESYPLNLQIVEQFTTMPRRMQQAARFVLQNPQEVALLSMREQARAAGVSPATMTRLAQFLGLSGYDEVRTLYHDAIREQSDSFAAKARLQIRKQEMEGELAIAARMFARLAHQIEGLSHPDSLKTVVEAANLLAGARRIYCLGMRSCYPVMWQFSYVLSLLGERVELLDKAGYTGSDALMHAVEGDVLFVMTINPYAQAAYDICEYGRSRGLRILAITDAEIAPVMALADVALIAPTESISFFHTIAPSFALAEILANLIAGRPSIDAPSALQQTDTHLRHLKTYKDGAVRAR